MHVFSSPFDAPSQPSALRRWMAPVVVGALVAAVLPLQALAAGASSTGHLVLQPHVKKSNTITTLSPVPTGAVFGQNVTLHATVTNTGHAFSAADKVQFYDGTTAIGGAVSVVVTSTTSPYSATAQITTATLTAGAHSITAVHLASTYLNASTSGAQTLVIGKALTTTVINATNPVGSVVFGQPTTFSVTVSPVAPGAGVPVGSVTITHGAQTLCTVNLIVANNGTNSCTGAMNVDPALGVNFVATYVATANFASSNDSTSLDITQASTNVSTFTVAPSTIGYGAEASVVFTTTVSAVAPASGNPTGTVAITQGATTLCTVTLVAGTGTCSPASQTALDVNVYQVTATYSGDSDYAGSTIDGALTVTRATTSLSSPTVLGSPVYGGTLSASTTLSSSSASVATAGDIVYSIQSGPNEYTCDAAVATTGTYQCSAWTPVSSSPTVPPAGSYSISVVFNPTTPADVAPAGPVAGSVFSVNPDTTTLGVTASATTTSFAAESSVTFSVTLTTGHGEQIPGAESATVSVGTATCIATINPVAGGASGSCSLSDSALSAGGPYSVSVSYGGDANLAAAGPTSAPSALTVTPDTVVLTISELPTTVTYGAEDSAVFSVLLATAHGESLAGSEPIIVHVGASSCTATLTPSAGGAQGTCSLASATALSAGGPYDVNATYPGDTNLAAAGPFHAATGFSVSKDSVNLAVSASPSTVNFGTESIAAFTVTLTTNNGEALPGAEAVTVFVDSSATCLATLAPGGSGGSGSCIVGNSAVPGGGPFDVTATYGGDIDLNGAGPTLAATGFTVVKDTTALVVSSAPTSVVFGNESTVSFNATVTTGNGETLPGAEPLQIHVGPASCVATLAPSGNGASGSCSIGDAALLGGGPYSITATYGGDSSLQASPLATAATGLTITTDSTLVFPRVSEVPPTVVYGNEGASTFLVSIITGNGEPLPNSSDIATVYVGSTTCHATLTAGGLGGTGTCSIANTALPTGDNYPVSVYFPGDGSLQANGPVPSASGFTVTSDSTTVAVSASSANVAFGQESSTSFNVTLSTGFGESLTGAELVTVNVGTAQCVATLNPGAGGASGSCSISDYALTPGGPYAISVSYPGNASLLSSGPSSALVGLTVGKSATTTSITSTAPSGSVVYGQNTSFSVHVEPVLVNVNQPTGNVTLSQSGTTICQFTLAAIDNGVGSCNGPITAIPGVGLTFTATYDGDGNFATSFGTTAKTVMTASTLTSIAVSRNPTVTGGALAITATVTVSSPGAGSPGGSVNFTAKGATIAGCGAVPVVGGHAVCNGASKLAPGSYALAATYAGDAATNASSSGPLALNVDTKNTAFIKAMFLAMLSRPVDARSLSAYNALLTKGHSRAQVALLLSSGTEYKVVQVRSMIHAYLHRGAQTTEILHWIGLINKGATYEQIRADIIGSPEYFARAGSTYSGFVTHAYKDVLGHAPSSASLAALVKLLTHHATRTQVAMSLLSSNEYRTLLVHGWMQTILQRTNFTGTSAWVSLLQIGVHDTSIIAAMVGSAEFFSHATK